MRQFCLVLAAFLLLAESSPRAAVDQPPLARLSFWIPFRPMADFTAVYDQHLAPILARHGLVPTPAPATLVGQYFSRLFPLQTAAQADTLEQALEADPAWQQAMQRLGTDFTPENVPRHFGRALRWQFGLYQAPAGPGQTNPAGPGRSHAAGPGITVGLWQTFSVHDGLPSASVNALVQDRAGHLWLGTDAGLCRYNGERFTTFTTRDGLPHDRIQAILEDRAGHLWLGTDTGLCRYDGETFTTFTTHDGLAGNSIHAILEDRRGHLWFTIGTGNPGGRGVGRYDGRSFRTFTSADGLSANWVTALHQDRAGHMWFVTAGVTLTAEGPRPSALCRYDGSGFDSFALHDEPMAWVSAVGEDQHGTLIAGIQTYPTTGVYRFDGGQFRPMGIELTSSPEEILADEQGHLWFGGRRDGVSRYDGTRLQTFTTQDGLAANALVHCLLEDRRGPYLGRHPLGRPAL